MSLAEFLRARIAPDEAVAHEFDWAKPDQYYTEELEASPEYVTCYISPARLLAECEAKRQIVDAYERGDEGSGPDYGYGLYVAMLALAQPYADHPDCLPEWRPSP